MEMFMRVKWWFLYWRNFITQLRRGTEGISYYVMTRAPHLQSHHLKCWSPSLSAVLFNFSSCSRSVSSTVEQWRVPVPLAKRVAVSFPACCFYAEVARILSTLVLGQVPGLCMEGQNLSSQEQGAFKKTL